MAKNSVADWDITPINNEDVGGIDLRENIMKPPAVNNAFREIMAQIKSGVGLLGTAQTWTAAQTFTGDGQVLILKPGTSAQTAFMRVQNEAGSALGYLGLDNRTGDNLTFRRNGAGNIDIHAGSSSGTITFTGAPVFNTAVPVSGGGTGSTSASAARTALGLAIGTDVQAYDADTAKIDVAQTWSATQSFGLFSTGGASDGSQIDSVNNWATRYSVGSTATRSRLIFYNPNGIVGTIQSSGSGTAYNTTSDERLKENFIPLDAGAIIDQVNVYQYQWIADGDLGYGPKAQELYQVFPQAVSIGSTGDAPGDEGFVPWGYDAAKMVPLLLAEVKALRARVAALEA